MIKGKTKSCVPLVQKNNKQEKVEGFANMLKDACLNDPNSLVVTKNDSSEKLKILITGGDKHKSVIGYKDFVSYPYTQPKFNCGDMVHFQYNQKPADWLVLSIEKQNYFDVRGRLVLCNEEIRYFKGTEKVSYPCVFLDEISSANLQNSGSDKPHTINSSNVIHTRKCDETSFVDVNKRFIFDKTPYKVVKVLGNLNEEFMSIFIKEDPILKQDDLINGFAYNKEVVQNDPIVVGQTTYTINNAPTDIKVGNTQTFSITKKENDIVVSGNYTITKNLSDYYATATMVGDTISIKCEKTSIKPLVVSIKDIDNNEVTDVFVRLTEGGLF